ncbi:3016_t:CDS:2 [Cetraspora pellucida]|uniref:3016_t:CDS:1 n=1 Tax=Cetraspora pellucida TaxID=1433469 RepID=A0A9N9GP74_9GLOM|nr:3016_t:CDS:2 [Cetraspora pellucida]
MYFYHLKFELYIPAGNNSHNCQNKFIINENSLDLFYVPKDIFAPLPVHSQLNNEPHQVPSIPPTPISKYNSSSGKSDPPSGWTIVGRRKSIASTSAVPSTIITSKPNFDKTHDFRFGKIEVEWFDNFEIIEAENMGENMNENQKSKSSSDKAVIPAGEFIPLKSGKTNFSYGVLHLYRDPSEILSSKDDQGFIRVGKNDKNNSGKQNSSGSNQNSVEKQEEFPGILNNEETILAVLAVPSFMSASDFLAFVAPVQRFVSHFRFIRDSAPNKFMVLMKFRHARAAWDFYRQFNGRPFSSMEPEICHVVYIKSIEFKSTSIPPDAFPFLHDPFIPSTQNDTTKSNDQTQQSSVLYELPTCPVCLERMDASVTGLLTILCQHTFHCDCLSKWGDSSCPICRYSQKSNVLDPSLGQNECGICGVTEKTSHLYALELETQRVWDYAGDGYVHRLIQNKSDGKLVELPSPDGPPQMQQPRAEVDQDKLDAIGLEYSYLLSTQLSSQRVYYEEKLESVTLQLSKLTSQVQKFEDEISILNQDKGKYKKENELLEKEKIPSLIKEKKAIEKKMEKFTEKSNKLEKELNGERELTKSLLMKQEYLQSQLENKDAKIKDLEEQVRDLMFFFSSQEKLKENPELAGGNIVVSENSGNSGGNARKKKGKR